MAKILIIEDEVELLDLFSTTLEEEGHEVIATSTWNQAREILISGTRAKSVDIVLADYILSDCNSLDSFEELRKQGVPLPLIIVMTGASIHELQSRQTQFRFLVLEKPFGRSVLLETIYQLLSGAASKSF